MSQKSTYSVREIDHAFDSQDLVHSFSPPLPLRSWELSGLQALSVQQVPQGVAVSGLYQNAIGEESEPDGRNTWWDEYKESEPMSIDLKHDFQYKKFVNAMNSLRENKLYLTDYDRRLFENLESAHDLLGRRMHLTVKQLNHIEQVAFDFEKGA